MPGPADLTKLSLELAARMIFLGKKAATLEEARLMAEKHLVDGSAYKKFKQVVAAQGGNPQALDKFELLPNATGMREITSPRAGYVSRINAQDIGVSSNMIGAGRDKKEDSIDPAVGIILEVKMGEKVDAGSVLCRLYYTKEDRVDEAAEMVEDAFRISAQKPDERELILEVVGLMGRFTGLLGLVVILAVAWLFSTHKKEIKLRLIVWGMGLQFAFAVLVLKTDFGQIFKRIGDGVNAMLEFAEVGSQFLFGPLGTKGGPYGVIFAFQVLPIVIFIASFFSILYYLGVMQVVVKAMAIAMQKVMGVSGAESLNVAASIFMGQTEAPLTIKPVSRRADGIRTVHHHDGGMAHVSGRGDGGLREDRGRFHYPPADRGDHDGAGHHHAGQDFHSGDRKAGHGGPRGYQSGEDRGQRDRRRGAGRGRRLAPGAQYRRHADRVSGADRHVQRDPGLAPHAAAAGLAAGIAGTDFRYSLRAGGVHSGRAVEGLRRHRRPVGHAPGAE